MSEYIRKLCGHIRRQPRAIVPLLAAFATGCSPLNVLDVLVPDGEYDLSREISYGKLPRQKLDVYRPATGRQSGPVMVFIYGGSWKTGERHQYRFVGEAFTRRGYTVVIPDYRLSPEATFPAFMNDAANAVRWVRENLRDANGGPRPVFLAGHSAGAHIAALLTVDDRYLQSAGLAREDICGVIGLAGPYAFDPRRYRSTRRAFAGLENTDIARPIRRIAGKNPPFLLLHGDDDTTVRPSNTVEFAVSLKQAGTVVQTRIFPDIGHSKILAAISAPFDDIAPVNDLIAAFIKDGAACR